MVTDYDCWHPEHDAVTVDQVIAYLNKNAENACKVVRQTVADMPKTRSCKCGSALEFAILTDRTKIPSEARKKLRLLLDKYLKVQEAGA
jgi:5'-methylthioadenosine phosphorylase